MIRYDSFRRINTGRADARHLCAMAVILIGALLTPRAANAQNVRELFTRIADSTQVPTIGDAMVVRNNNRGTIIFLGSDSTLWRATGMR